MLTIKGTADAYSQIKVYDGTTSVGTASTKADGTWSFTHVVRHIEYGAHLYGSGVR
jgi:hypothetical protein